MHLPHLPDSTAASHIQHGLHERTHLGVRYSFGDYTISHRMLTAIMYPVLFSSLVLIDPAILPYPGACLPCRTIRAHMGHPAARRLGIQEGRARHVPHDTVLRG
ncbi:hypothetical protein A0H81_05699 [Grifola frondosa]|uniref:Uncharacterized protein n=1 Tax=Grifola frondosa TaxID=5627 RepID=A0A1C7MD77_GRIFR|nr:hypothetical protein A0H81_05699 [Grifola frondosa]